MEMARSLNLCAAAPARAEGRHPFLPLPLQRPLPPLFRLCCAHPPSGPENVPAWSPRRSHGGVSCLPVPPHPPTAPPSPRLEQRPPGPAYYFLSPLGHRLFSRVVGTRLFFSCRSPPSARVRAVVDLGAGRP